MGIVAGLVAIAFFLWGLVAAAAWLVAPPWIAIRCWRAHRRGLRCWRLALASVASPVAVVLIVFAVGRVRWTLGFDDGWRVPTAADAAMALGLAVTAGGALVTVATLVFTGCRELVRIYEREAADKAVLLAELQALSPAIDEARP